MKTKCGDCLFFNGAGIKCGGGHPLAVTAAQSSCADGIKAPARLFGGKKVCGGCRFFMGAGKKCGGRPPLAVCSNFSAYAAGYAPIQG